MDEWKICYLLIRNGIFLFCETPKDIFDTLKGDLESLEGEIKWSDDHPGEFEGTEEWRKEATEIREIVPKIREWIATAKHRDHADFDLYSVTVFESPRTFIESYLDCAPEFGGWE